MGRFTNSLRALLLCIEERGFLSYDVGYITGIGGGGGGGTPERNLSTSTGAGTAST